MKWTDVQDIAIELYEAHPDVDPQYVRFTDLHAWVMALPGFSDDPSHSNEKSSRPSKWPGSTKPADFAAAPHAARLPLALNNA